MFTSNVVYISLELFYTYELVPARLILGTQNQEWDGALADFSHSIKPYISEEHRGTAERNKSGFSKVFKFIPDANIYTLLSYRTP